MQTPLEKILVETIKKDGPLNLESFMAQALGHPEHGYYMTRDPFGKKGDFTTAPEISQLFGDIIGVWCAYTWMEMGKPEKFSLVECGPGRGTLMADLLRASKVVPGFENAVEVHMVETSSALRIAQESALENIKCPKYWHKHLDDIPEHPFILIANEFLDALPIRQFTFTKEGWQEICVGINKKDKLEFVQQPVSEDDQALIPASIQKEAKPGNIYEYSQAVHAVVKKTAGLCEKQGGYALFVDYGYEKPPLKSTLQSVRKHRPSPVLKFPGEQDITAHVDFSLVKNTASKQDCLVTPMVSQGDFLLNLGVEARAHALSKIATHDHQRLTIRAGLSRLTSSKQMGQLFKVMALYPSTATEPEGFVTRND